MAVKEGWRGRFFDDFEVGDVYEHPLGRTVTTTDNAWFTLLTQNTAGKQFWLNVLLTILGHLPGTIHAVRVIAKY